MHRATSAPRTEAAVTRSRGFVRRGAVTGTSFILGISAVGVGVVCASSYAWLRNNSLQHPENLLLVFAVALIADFFMISTLCCVGCLYCKRRKAFEEADKAHELTAEFSDYNSRYSGRKGRSRRQRAQSQMPAEYAGDQL